MNANKPKILRNLRFVVELGKTRARGKTQRPYLWKNWLEYKKHTLFFLLICQSFHTFKLRFIQMTMWHRKPTVESQPQMENIMTVTQKKDISIWSRFFFFNHETGKPLAEIHRATEFAREMKMFACREVWKEEEEIKAKCSGVRNIGVLVGELW